jgi:hypothetical protein
MIQPDLGKTREGRHGNSAPPVADFERGGCVSNICIDCGRPLASANARRCKPCSVAAFKLAGAMPSIRMVSSEWAEESDGTLSRCIWNAADEDR